MQESYQENNLDIGGRLTWVMAPTLDIAALAPPPFMIIESGRFHARPKFYSKRSGKDGFLILYTESGKGLLKYKGGEYELTPGSAALIDCYQHHEYMTYDDRDGKWSFHWLHFSGSHMEFYTQAIYGDSYALLNVGDEPLIIFDTIVKNLQFGTPDRLVLLCDCVYKLLTLMIEAARVEKLNRDKSPATKEKLKEAVAYIRENYWTPDLRLEQVAKRFTISKFHFVKVFKEYTGMTPYSFLTAERVNVAKVLLQTTDLPISKICIMVGFKDETNFINKFKTAHKVTPQAYRLSMQGVNG